MNMGEYALRYLNRGFAVVPANGKRPALIWKQYQHARPTEAEVRAWWAQAPQANIALVTGAVSGVVVVDIDGVETPKLSPTPLVRSSPGHYHYYYRHPGGVVPCSAGAVAPHVDIRGDGGIVILPPSIHYDRRGQADGQYTWLVGPRDADFAPLPDWIIEKARARQDVAERVKGSALGARNVTTTAVVGSLLARYPPQQWEDVCWPLIVAYNAQRNRPPLGEGELRTIFDSIARRQAQSK